MLQLIKSIPSFHTTPVVKIWDKDDDNVLAYMRGDLLFIFNFNPEKSFSGYGFLAPQGEYKIVLDSDNIEFGGFGRIDDSVNHFTQYDELYAVHNKGWLKTYLPARTAIVLQKQNK